MIKVMVVDDSAVIRQVVSAVLNATVDIRVVDSAPDPVYALEKMKKDWPDVLVLDVEMPRMDGITFLKQLMSEHPTAVVVLSSLTTQGSATAIEALRAGAVQVLAKSSLGVKQALLDDAASLVSAVRAAARAKVSLLKPKPDTPAIVVRPKLSADVVIAPPTQGAMIQTTERIVLLGASTGGTQALEEVLKKLSRTCPPIAIVQHMPPNFTESFAKRLDQLCDIDVREAKHGDRLLPGLALIAPGGKHLMIKRSGAQYLVDVVDGPLVSRHCPSVDVLFRSGAKFAGRNAIGVIMTGMGDDGAKGLKEMQEAGGRTYAQDETSCVVFGMPKEAIKLGAADEVLPLSRISSVIGA
ncbi:protein-glutamate methylesterase/protein-glutamine glutaminase [Deefgea piscis]|uniref:protein-glutamate methylesterase/protein-glutamine glutaminase n=1 Tax=Deefgea piscis TaxID=2739061 RepID=UPI001C81C01C|nr:chemotaxis response regulator protein-glutamate methylesterase [Deefgea piscis]QZA81063.1 chemotaxis response regulator protein-glutamate methylesterase [Deefgea piscis]